jgi:hypothetical protein
MNTDRFSPGHREALSSRATFGFRTAGIGLLALLTTASPLLRGDVLVNGDFSEGRAHWGGDAENLAAPDGTTAADSGSAPAGVTVTLKKDGWTMIYQSFTIRDPELYYTITFKLSADYKLANPGSHDEAAGDFSNGPGLMRFYDVSLGHWSLITTGTDPTDENSIRVKSLDPDVTSAQSQTLTGKLINLNNDADASLILAFPPGEGSVTLTTVSLSPTDPNSGP